MKAPSDIEWSDTPAYHTNHGGYSDYRTDGLSAVDWLNQRFHLGDTVMYCIGAGRGQMMAIGTVKQIRAKKRAGWHWEKQPDTTWERVDDNLDDPYTEIEVQVLTEKTSGSWDNTKRTRPAWVNPMNITVYTPKENDNG